jgi:hypothetical protein
MIILNLRKQVAPKDSLFFSLGSNKSAKTQNRLYVVIGEKKYEIDYSVIIEGELYGQLHISFRVLGVPIIGVISKEIIELHYGNVMVKFCCYYDSVYVSLIDPDNPVTYFEITTDDLSILEKLK